MIDATKTISYIVDWLKNYCDTAGMSGFVVGISGGIDSAVTSTLCARTGRTVMALNLPIHPVKTQKDLADQQIAWLETDFDNVTSMALELTSVFSALGRILPEEIQDGLTMANAQSRLRMLTLYAVANHNRLLVAGTGNKVEDFGVGFFTKYGDGGVDLAPIADLMKSEVYALADEMAISKAIINAAPTDGLWGDNRTDESQIGATYDELEWAMGFDADSEDETDLTSRQQETLSIYRKRHRTNRHKMVAIPVCNIPDRFRDRTDSESR